MAIDSWQKLGIPNSRFDELRNEYPNSVFNVIFQQNGEGGTRGGGRQTMMRLTQSKFIRLMKPLRIIMLRLRRIEGMN